MPLEKWEFYQLLLNLFQGIQDNIMEGGKPENPLIATIIDYLEELAQPPGPGCPEETCPPCGELYCPPPEEKPEVCACAR